MTRLTAPPAGGATAFSILAFTFTVTMLGTTLPTPLYPAYEQRFHFGALTVTVVFAMYAVGVLTALLTLGRASDTAGRKPLLAGGLGAAGVSSALFLVASTVQTGGLTLLLVARFASGLSAGIFTGTATAALADVAGERRLRASLTAALANIGGLGLGPLVAGVLARYVDQPLRTAFYLHLGLLAVSGLLLAAVAEPVQLSGDRRYRMQRLGVPRQLRAIFLAASTAGFAGFAVLGFFTAVTPAALALLGHHNPAVTGVVVFAVFAASAAGQVVSTVPSVRRALLVGTGILVVGSVVVGIGIGATSLSLLLAGGVVAGLGQGLSFRSALGSVTGASPADQRAAVSSSFFAACYVGISLPVIGIGAASDAYGLARTAEVFAGIMAALSLVALGGLTRSAPAD